MKLGLLFKRLMSFLCILLTMDAYAWLVNKKDLPVPTLSQEAQRKQKALQQNENLKRQDTLENQTLGDEPWVAALNQARQAYIASVKRHWPHAEKSHSYQWVNYTEDWQIKSVIDFLNNQIRISIPRMRVHQGTDFAAQEEMVQGQLEYLLGLSLQGAIQADGVVRFLEASDQQDFLPEEALPTLLFSELYESSPPERKNIQQLAARLMADAYVRYHDQLSSNSAVFNLKLREKITYVIPLPEDRLVKKAKEYAPLAVSYGARLSVPPDLILAIMHTESHFNPLARSYIPAFGLMQIVPSTAGKDAVRSLYQELPGKRPKLSPGYLYNPENNVELGAAYLQLLYYHYLSEIQDPVSRMYVAIAAYNAGASNVARAFVSVASMREAANKINQLNDKEVLNKLRYDSPSKQTRDYVSKVLKWKKYYEMEGLQM